MNILFIILFAIGYILSYLGFLYIQKKQIDGLMIAIKKDLENKSQNLLQDYVLYNQKTIEKRGKLKLEHEKKIEQINKDALEKIKKINA